MTELVGEGRIPRKKVYATGDAAAAMAMLGEARAANNATAAGEQLAAGTTVEEQLAGADSLPRMERVARIKKLIESTAHIKARTALVTGSWVPKAEVDAERVARVYSLRAKLQELPLRAPQIAGKTEAECERSLTEWIKEVCDYYAEGGS